MASPDLGVDLQDLLIFWRELTLNGEKWVKSHLHWDNISKIAQNSACDTFPGSRSYLMKRFHFFFGDVLRDWLLKQDVWLTIFFISKQLLVKSLHDQDQIWWKVWNFSSETFLVKVDLSKVVKLAWTILTLAWTYQKQIDLLSHDLFFFGDILKNGWLDCLLNYKKNHKSRLTMQDLWIFWREQTLIGEKWVKPQPNNGMKCKMIFSGRPPIPSMHIGIIFQRLLRILLVISFQDQDHTWWKDLTFSSEMFLEIGYWSKVFDWHFFFIPKQLLVQSLHDQDHIWWKVLNFSSETFLEKVDLSKVVNFSDLDIF